MALRWVWIVTIFAPTLWAKTYLGYTTFDLIRGTSTKIPTVADFVSCSPETKTEGLAFVRLSFGGFKSHEYLTQFYHVTNASLQHNTFTLNGNVSGNGPDLSFVLDKSEDGGKSLLFNVRSARTSLRGQTRVIRYEGNESISRLNSIWPEIPKAPMLTGRYEGYCSRGGDTTLQLEAAREYSWERASPYPFAGYVITGRLARAKNGVSYIEQSLSGTMAGYNPFTNTLTVPFSEDACGVSEESIECNRCVLSRQNSYGEAYGSIGEIFGEPHAERQSYQQAERHHLEGAPTDKYEISPLSPSDLKSYYIGYLHNDLRDRYQAISIETDVTDQKEGKSVVTLTTYILDRNSRVVTEGFETRVVPGVPQQHRMEPFSFEAKPSLVVSGREIYLHIKHWDKDFLIGTWFTRTAGRWGTFELKRTDYEKRLSSVEMPAPFSSKILHPLEGRYETRIPRRLGPDLIQMSLQTSSQVSGVYNPFYPYAIHGSGRMVRYLLPGQTPLPGRRRGEDVHPAVNLSLHDSVMDPFSGVFRSRFDHGVFFGRIDPLGNFLFNSGVVARGKNLLEFLFHEYR